MSPHTCKPCLRSVQACGPPPPVAAALASSLRAPSRGDPPIKNRAGRYADTELCAATIPAWPPGRALAADPSVGRIHIDSEVKVVRVRPPTSLRWLRCDTEKNP